MTLGCYDVGTEGDFWGLIGYVKHETCMSLIGHQRTFCSLSILMKGCSAIVITYNQMFI